MFGYLIQRVQGVLPLNPRHFGTPVERLQKEFEHFLLSEHLRQRTCRPVSGNLIVLDLLRRSDDRNVEHGRFLQLRDRFLTLGQQPLHSLALPGARLIAKPIEYRPQANHLLLRFIQVHLKRAGERFRRHSAINFGSAPTIWFSASNKSSSCS
jgi:hypothetical protein